MYWFFHVLSVCYLLFYHRRIRVDGWFLKLATTVKLILLWEVTIISRQSRSRSVTHATRPPGGPALPLRPYPFAIICCPHTSLLPPALSLFSLSISASSIDQIISARSAAIIHHYAGLSDESLHHSAPGCFPRVCALLLGHCSPCYYRPWEGAGAARQDVVHSCRRGAWCCRPAPRGGQRCVGKGHRRCCMRQRWLLQRTIASAGSSRRRPCVPRTTVCYKPTTQMLRAAAAVALADDNRGASNFATTT